MAMISECQKKLIDKIFLYVYAYFMKINAAKTKKQFVETQQYPCMCAVIRKTGRLLTKKYDRYLKPSGLKVTQFSMLANISRNPGIAVSKLAELLVMDQSTVTRNLRVLEKIGYIHIETDTVDHRIKRIQITDFGISRMDEAWPYWEKAQLEIERIIGREHIEELLSIFREITG